MKTRALLTGLSLSTFLALSACQLYYGPSPMPSGYVNHHKLYKTPQNKRPFFIGPEYSPGDVAESSRLWTAAATDLLNHLEEEIVMDSMMVSLQPAEPKDSFQIRMDYYLREVLTERGYMIVTDTPKNVPIIEYSGYLVEPKTPLSLIDGGNPLGEKDGYPDDMPAHERENELTTNIWLSLSIIDPQATRRVDRVLVESRNLYPILNKDLREIATDLPSFVPITGERHPIVRDYSLPKLPDLGLGNGNE